MQQGGQAAIYKGTYNTWPAAIKVMPKDRNKHKHVELRALQSAGHHPHLVHWHAAHQKPDGVFVLALELAYCDMLEVLHTSPSRGLGNGHRTREWMLQVASAGAHLHSKGIAHRDLKPENLLLCSQADPRVLPVPSKLPPLSPGGGATTQGSGQAGVTMQGPPPLLPKDDILAQVHAADLLPDRPIVKMCDFGYAAMAREGDKVVGYSPVGSMRYAPPEVYQRNLMFTDPDTFRDLWGRQKMEELQGQAYDACAADVWSFGVTLYVLVLGSMPFKAPCVNNDRFRSFIADTQPHALQEEVCAPRHAVWQGRDAVRRWRWPRNKTPALTHLIAWCMSVRPEDRPTFEQVAKHPWFTDPSWSPAPAPSAVKEPLSAGAASVATSQSAERSGAMSYVPSLRTFASSRQTLVTSEQNSVDGWSTGGGAQTPMAVPHGIPTTARGLPAVSE